ncbi:hypothetical protein PIB30_035157 [Stylosanthes scabra]|uniref:Uncharacterized protein n=1 Tax=Stylosanthes scabra TaxID=79078 RepID=A0ABU6XD79_9FABA|nr:hypothetical protein [Stylosanthes scabra]
MKSKSSEKSLCEKSMMVVANVIRLSSFSIAHKTLGVSTNGKNGKGLSSGSDLSDLEPLHEKEPMVPLRDQFPAATSRRSQEPLSRANRTYVIKPSGSHGSSTGCVVYKDQRISEANGNNNHNNKAKKEECVDGLASDYITKIRSKLGCGL